MEGLVEFHKLRTGFCWSGKTCQLRKRIMLLSIYQHIVQVTVHPCAVFNGGLELRGCHFELVRIAILNWNW